MRRLLPVFFGLAALLQAEEASVTNAVTINAVSSPTPEISWTNIPVHCWGDKALPYAQAGLKAWYAETAPKKKEEFRHQVLELAIKSQATDIGLELFAGRTVDQAELPVPTNSVTLPLTIIKEWDLTHNRWNSSHPSVIRRIGPKNFELWTPKSGWLFDEKGSLLAEAKVPRRDGIGHQWYGAFLPDGQWITTELWDFDGRIYIYSPSNKLLSSFPLMKYSKVHDDIGIPSHYSADWAIADRDQRHWIIHVLAAGCDRTNLKVSEWGWKPRIGRWLTRHHLWVPDSSWLPVEKITNLRSNIDFRNLGSRFAFCGATTDSDNGAASISWDEPGHGPGVGWPDYSMNSTGHGWNACIPWKDRHNFGFFPGSLTTWVGSNKYPSRPEIDPNRPRRDFEYFRSWIIDPDGKVLGWLPAERVGDDPDGKRMWFVNEQGHLLKVAPDGVVSEVMQPTLAGPTGENAPFAHVLFPDLKLGFFYTKPGHLVLARWP